jgi:hypothetical protein
MSNYPDGMTSRDWAHIDGEEHHEECYSHPDYEHFCQLKGDGLVHDDYGNGGVCDEEHDECDICKSIECRCDCKCDTLYPSKEDIELEKLGL